MVDSSRDCCHHCLVDSANAFLSEASCPCVNCTDCSPHQHLICKIAPVLDFASFQHITSTWVLSSKQLPPQLCQVSRARLDIWLNIIASYQPRVDFRLCDRWLPCGSLRHHDHSVRT
ncbi:hypothetical protein M8818_007654 [Zalaria obscura]|uniref:Uncharacterized protein n=1 Tax=Zalaria obscura TaxID=2024903 RepID=A0ACC3S362_9PEZI